MRTAFPAKPEVDPPCDLNSDLSGKVGALGIGENQSRVCGLFYAQVPVVIMLVTTRAERDEVLWQRRSLVSERHDVMQLEPVLVRTSRRTATVSVTPEKLSTLSPSR